MDKKAQKFWNYIHEGDNNLALALLRKCNDLNILTDALGRTPIMVALLFGRKPVVNYLLEVMNDMNQVNQDGENAFYYAVFARVEMDIIEKMINKGVDINNYPGDGVTPLMILAMRGIDDQISLLIDRGIYLHVESEEKKTALTHASYEGHLSTVRLLLDATKNVNDLFASDSNIQESLRSPIIYKWIQERELDLSLENQKKWKAIRLKRLLNVK